ncbi:MAG TPA: amidohydrolase [Jiangellaceae bacterium]
MSAVRSTTLLRNGRVHSPADPSATALLVSGGRIAWVGDESTATTHVDAADAVVDLGGALVTPAFVDAHLHVTETGLAREGVDLTGCASLSEFLGRVEHHATSRPGQAVLGHGWDERSWPEARPPTRAEVDRASGGAVAYLSRIDVHSAVVSSALLDAAPDIARAAGFADGLVRRDAHHLARRATRDRLTPELRRELQRTTLRHAAATGIGAVHEIGAPHIAGTRDLTALLDVAGDEGLPEVFAYWGAIGDGVETAVRLGCAGAAGDLNLDGSLGSRTARLSQPYTDAADQAGFLYVDLDEATEHVVACTRAGIQAGFHCIGDEAVRVGVTAIERAADRCGVAEIVAARHRLEHVEMITPDLVTVMATLGVVASVQPRFDEFWGGDAGMYATRLGVERARTMNPFASMARAGVPMALGSDSPVTPMGGWEMVRAAVAHHRPGERLAAGAAFEAATRGGWRAARVDDAGVLAPGMRATYAVWDVPPDQLMGPGSGLPDLSPASPLPACLRTVVRGRTVFDRSAL